MLECWYTDHARELIHGSFCGVGSKYTDNVLELIHGSRWELIHGSLTRGCAYHNMIIDNYH